MRNKQIQIEILPMGRKKRWSEDMQARFGEGTFERIAAVLKATEDRTEFVRIAVDNELRRREAKATSQKKGLRTSRNSEPDVIKKKRKTLR